MKNKYDNYNDITPENELISLYTLFNERKYKLTVLFHPIYTTSNDLFALAMEVGVVDLKSEVVVPSKNYFSFNQKIDLMNVFEWQLNILIFLLPWCREKNIPISINMHSDIISDVLGSPLSSQLKLLAPWVRLEIQSSHNQSSVTDNNLLILLSKLSPLWLDDFGDSYCNHSFLITGGFEAIKISNKLFDLIRFHVDGKSYLQYIQSLALENKPLIANGVWSYELFNYCKESGVYACQGWLWKGVPLEKIHLLETHI